MKKFLLIIFLISLIPGIEARSVILDEIVELNVKKNRKLTDLVFGKKSGIKIKPFSIFEIDRLRYCIVDQVNSSLLIYSNKWKIKKKIKKVMNKFLVSPVSGTSGPNGSFFISDSFHREVYKFGLDLRLKAIVISNPDYRITGISFFGERLFAVDTGNHSVLIFDKDGVLIEKFGKRGNGDGEFNFPTHIFTDAEHIYITDALNFRVQIFDHKGNFISKFGKNGKYGGDFSKPKGIVVDSQKRIFVTDVIFDNVQVFDLRGRFLSYFGGPGKEKGEFWMPSGLMVDSENKVYVCDTYNSRIQIFRVVEGESEKANLD